MWFVELSSEMKVWMFSRKTCSRLPKHERNTTSSGFTQGSNSLQTQQDSRTNTVNRLAMQHNLYAPLGCGHKESSG